MSGITLAVAQHMLDQYIAAEQACCSARAPAWAKSGSNMPTSTKFAPAARTGSAGPAAQVRCHRPWPANLRHHARGLSMSRTVRIGKDQVDIKWTAIDRLIEYVAPVAAGRRTQARVGHAMMGR